MGNKGLIPLAQRKYVPSTSDPTALTGLHQLVVHTYKDGTIDVYYQHLDMNSRRMVPEKLHERYQDARGLMDVVYMFAEGVERLSRRLNSPEE